MKVYFTDLDFETTLEDVFQSIKPYDTFNEFKKELLENGYYDDYFEIYHSKEESTHSCKFEADVYTNSYGVIDYINNLEAVKDDQFILIIKDELTGELDESCNDCDGEGYMDEDYEEECETCEGTGGYEELAYISFEAFTGTSTVTVDDPLPLKGGEYHKKTMMTEKQMNRYNNFFEKGVVEMSDCKYQEYYFVRESKYDPKQWTKSWLELDNKRNLK